MEGSPVSGQSSPVQLHQWNYTSGITPVQLHQWNYAVSFSQGSSAALDQATDLQQLTALDVRKSTFEIVTTDKTASDFSGRVPASLDDGEMYPKRQRYCLELTVRFGHNQAFNWSLYEGNTQTTARQRAMSQYIHDVDNIAHNNSRYCLARFGERYFTHLPDGGSHQPDLSKMTGKFSVEWFTLCFGGNLSQGVINQVPGGMHVKPGEPPSDSDQGRLAVI